MKLDRISKEIKGRIYGFPMWLRVKLIRLLVGKRMVIMNAFFGPGNMIQNLYPKTSIVTGCTFIGSPTPVIKIWSN